MSTPNGLRISASSSKAHLLAALAGRALLDPREAARALMTSAIEPTTLVALLDYALVPDADLDSFEAEGHCYLLALPRVGRCWLAPPGRKRALLPPAPTFSPRGLRALARGLVTEVTAA